MADARRRQFDRDNAKQTQPKKKRGRQMVAWQFLRDAAALEFLYSTGIRIHELVGMDHDDIDRRSLCVRVLGKGGKERMVILGEPAIEVYDRYRAGIASSPVPAFISAGGNRLSARSIQQRFKVYLEHAGLDNALTPHKLRHSFATHMLDHGADLRNVQELLGHANLSTTQIYAQLTAERMRKSYDKAHPTAD
jgi:site-specific recombinase XerD